MRRRKRSRRWKKKEEQEERGGILEKKCQQFLTLRHPSNVARLQHTARVRQKEEQCCLGDVFEVSPQS